MCYLSPLFRTPLFVLPTAALRENLDELDTARGLHVVLQLLLLCMLCSLLFMDVSCCVISVCCLYIYIYIYTHTNIYIYSYVYICSSLSLSLYIYIYTHMALVCVVLFIHVVLQLLPLRLEREVAHEDHLVELS